METSARLEMWCTVDMENYINKKCKFGPAGAMPIGAGTTLVIRTLTPKPSGEELSSPVRCPVMSESISD